MRSKTLLARLALLGVAVTVIAAGAPPSPPRAPAGSAPSKPDFEVQRIADGVYAVVRTYPPGLMCDGNCVFIVDDDGVVVVDAPEATRDMLAALRTITRKPVRYVINTHGHDDHITGNQVYRDSFPGVEFIGHARLRDYLPTTGAENRRQMIAGAPPYVAHIRDLMSQGKSIAGGELTDEERVAFESDARLVDRYMAEVPRSEMVLPTITIEDRLTLHRGKRTIDIRHLGDGHTRADLIVHLPDDGVLVTGDLVVWPIPLIGAPQSHVGEWAGTLEKLRALPHTVLVPGHGPVLRDDTYLGLVTELMGSLKAQTAKAVAAGKSLDETRGLVNLDDLERRFAGDSKLRRFLFDRYVRQPGVASAYADAGGKP